MNYTKTLNQLSWWLLVIGGLNWGLTAFNYNVVKMLLGTLPTVEMLVYVLIGLSALYQAAMQMGLMKK